MSKKKYSRSFEIALSAVSCAVAVLFLLLGTLFNTFLLATGYFMAEVALMVPLSKNFVRGDFLAYLGTCLLTVLLGAIGNVWTLVPFIMFFGLHPLANCLQARTKFNRWAALILKIVWFDFTLWVMYKLVFGGNIGDESDVYRFVNRYIWAFIAVFGSLFCWVYDILIAKCQTAVNRLVYRIKK